MEILGAAVENLNFVLISIKSKKVLFTLVIFTDLSSLICLFINTVTLMNIYWTSCVANDDISSILARHESLCRQD